MRDYRTILLCGFLAILWLDRFVPTTDCARINKHVAFLHQQIQQRQRQRSYKAFLLERADEWSWRATLSEQRSLINLINREADGDGFAFQFLHNINNKPAVAEVLAVGGKRTIIEGDVSYKRSLNNTPIMFLPPQSSNGLKLKDWLREMTRANRTFMLSISSTEGIVAAMQYVFAFSDFIHKPYIVHANIGNMPSSLETSLDAKLFMSQAQSLAPYATVSVGWAESLMHMDDTDLMPKIPRYKIALLLEMLEYTFEVPQVIMFSCKAIPASFSIYELLWLIRIREDFMLRIYADERDIITNWTGLVRLRQYVPKNRVLYDFAPNQLQSFMQALEQAEQVADMPATFDRTSWRAVHFLRHSSTVSTVMLSETGVAFVGYPTSFLLSRTYTRASHMQTVFGRLLFVDRMKEGRTVTESGLAIYLLDTVDDIPSPDIRGGLRAFVGRSGIVSLEDRRKRRPVSGASDDDLWPNRAFAPASVSRLPRHDCYSFRLTDEGHLLTLTVTPDHCRFSTGRVPGHSWSRTLQLDVDPPPDGRLRYVIVQKTGGPTADVFLESLTHRGSAAGFRPSISLIATSSIALILLLIRR